jgi:FAD/FMN-containing dehydrogenase
MASGAGTGAEVSRRRETLAGWGNQPVAGRERRGEDLQAITRGAVLTRGLGRAYGDAALPPPGVVEVAGSTLADRILHLDEERGVLRAEAGLSLRTLNRLLMPRGWFSPVTPGTENVTLGGMVAADVHGKNHHVAGTFGAHVHELLLRTAGGRTLRCSPNEESELFWATVGGMGLTGHVLEVEHRLERIPSPWILCETRRYAHLAELVEGLREASQHWPFTASWVDCLGTSGRGVLHLGRWATPDEAPREPPAPRRELTVPFHAPGFLLNPLSVGAFNAFFYASQKSTRHVVHPAPFFYPLDRVRAWPRLYGRRGMTQHQCVLPAADATTVERFLTVIRQSGGRCFLAVLKDFGAEGKGTLSFPRPGLTLALDFAVGPRTHAQVARWNAEVRALGGRVYLAKDAFSTAEDVAAMEGERLTRFLAVRERWDPEHRLGSRLSARLFGDGARATAGATAPALAHAGGVPA